MEETDLNAAPRVSVVLPVRNACATLPAAWAALQAQSLKEWECIAVDDGSTDGSGEWLEAAAGVDARLRVLHRPPEGIVAALNHGLALARAPWIARLDADDVCAPQRLETQSRFLTEHPEVGVVGSLVRFVPVSDAFPGAGYREHVDWLNSVVTPEEMERGRFVECPLAHPSVMFRRSVAEAHGTYRDGNFPEDYELWLRWLDAGVRMAKVPVELLEWRDSPGRLSRTDDRYSPDAFYRLKARYLARWLQRERHGRAVWIWGAGRLTRRRVDWLIAEGIQVEAFVDIDPHKQGLHRDGRVVHAPEAIPMDGTVLVLGYVANRGAREIQRRFLRERGAVEGHDFLFAA